MNSAVFRAMAAVMMVLLMPFAARADGKVFKVLVEDPSAATMPDQQALIHFKNGVETLAIETRFTGSAENFAWVVPLPAAPEVSPATPGLFKTLRAMHQPEIVANHRSLSIVWAPIGLILLVGVLRPKQVWRVGIAVVGIVAVWLLMVPSLGKARGISGFDMDEVTELSRQLVGDYEVTVIESKEPDALVKWLAERGFGVPAGAEKVIAAYVADGWVFAAAKMRRDVAAKHEGPVTPHPLVFKFPVKSPVYPMRLTGVENGGPLKVELYVLADTRAEAPGFTVERCGELSYRSSYFDTSMWRRPPRGTGVEISHSWLSANAPGALVSTKLTAELPPEAMTSDVAVNLVPLRAERSRLWTDEATLDRAIDVGMFVACGALLGVLVRAACRRQAPHRGASIGAAAAVALIAGAAVYAATERAGATRRARELAAYSIAVDVFGACESRREKKEEITEKWLREVTRELARAYAFERDGDDKNMAIEEDSPGNYVIRPDGGDWMFVWYSYFGSEHAMPLFTN